MDEFQIIEKIFKPLTSTGAPSFNLENDTAIFSPPNGFDLVLTKDAMIEDVHFLKAQEPSVIAKRLLRSNLSDLAAGGAKPVGYLLAIMGADLDEAWLRGFAAGLKEDQTEFGISLFGGDTTAGAKTLSLSLTALGIVKKGKGLTRAGSRFEKPEPRLALGQKLIGMATACVDISDRLVADLGHLAKASKVGAEIYLDKIPVSKSGENILELITAGDDYELLFTVPESSQSEIETLSKKLNLPIAEIGKITEDPEVVVFDKNKAKVVMDKKGYRHFN
jgi:thiamine-monophosphate kinase